MKLLDRVRHSVRSKHFSYRTEQVYVYWIERFIRYHGIRHPDTMGAPEVEAFLTHLAVDGHVSASTQNQALAALLFLYSNVLGRDIGRLNAVRAERPVRVPSVLSRDEVHALLIAVDQVSRTEPYGLMARLMYGAGLRLMECCRLRMKDVDLERGQLTVRGGKGDKDRYVMLPVATQPAPRPPPLGLTPGDSSDISLSANGISSILPDNQEKPMNATSLTFLVLAVASELPKPEDVKIEEVARVPSYCEGIVFDHAGNAYVSHGKFVTKVTPDGKKSQWLDSGGAPNGHKVLADGTHLVCDGNLHAVLHVSAEGKILGKASEKCGDKPLRGPNDLTLDVKNGGFYFTDPGGSDDKKLIGTIHYVDNKGVTHLCAEGLAFPNGIVLTPDGKRLLVAESKKNRVLEYSAESPGKLGPMKVFCDLPTKMGEQIDNQPDGMCLDSAGNLYVAHYGMKQVQVLDPTGKVIRRYPGGNMTTSNVAFGGPEMDTLYITGGIKGEGDSEGGLFKIKLTGVKGLKILPEKK
jgi:gluconolactonase